MEPLVERRLTLAGVGTRALELEGTGPPLLLLHGYGDSADTWRKTLGRLARLGRRAMAIDFPGFGAADDLSSDPILPQLDRFAADAARGLAPEGGAVVAGNSLGGCVALRLAERRELGLAGVVPIAPAGLDMARWFALIERDPVLRSLLAIPVPVPGYLVRRVVSEIYRRLTFARPGAIDPWIVAAFAEHYPDRGAIVRRLATARRLLPELRDPFRLERISCPVMLAWGDRDQLVFRTGCERVLETVPDSALEVIPDCGHCPQVEAAWELTELLVDFPQRLARAA